MKLEELLHGLENGTIKIKESTHVINLKGVIRDLERNISFFKKSLEKYKDDNSGMRDYYNTVLNKDYNTGEEISGGIGSERAECCDCSERFNMVIFDSETIDFVSRSGNECSGKSMRDKKMMEATIKVPSGKLLFCNFFKTDKIYDKPFKKGDINNICYNVGQFELMEYLASENIGYGQMGNMGVNIYRRLDGKEIIVGDSYSYNEEDDEDEVEREFEGFENLGYISLSVWRWMCGDLEVLDGHGEVYPSDLVINGHIDTDYKDYVLLDVAVGEWKIEHYYAHNQCDNGIYSRLFLV